MASCKNIDHITNSSGLLASMVYLKGEAKKAGLTQTEQAIGQAIRSYFADLLQAGEETEQIQYVSDFLDKALNMNEYQLHQLIGLINYFDEGEEDPVIV